MEMMVAGRLAAGVQRVHARTLAASSSRDRCCVLASSRKPQSPLISPVINFDGRLASATAAFFFWQTDVITKALVAEEPQSMDVCQCAKASFKWSGS